MGIACRKRVFRGPWSQKRRIFIYFAKFIHSNDDYNTLSTQAGCQKSPWPPVQITILTSWKRVHKKHPICGYFLQGRFYVGTGGTCPQIHLSSPDSKASWKNVSLYGVRIFRFRRTNKMYSVMKGLMGQCPQNFWARTAPDFLTVTQRLLSQICRSTI